MSARRVHDQTRSAEETGPAHNVRITKSGLPANSVSTRKTRLRAGPESLIFAVLARYVCDSRDRSRPPYRPRSRIVRV